MIRLVVLMFPRHLWVLAEGSPGTASRLVGDPWGDDGAMPMLLAQIGRERYIGTTAEYVGYESPRAELEPVLGPVADFDRSLERAAAFLRLLDQAVRRRFPHDELSWRFALAAQMAPDAAATVSAACWLAGLGAAKVEGLGALPPLPPPPASSSSASEDSSTSALSLFGLVDERQAIAGLACSSNDGSMELAVLELTCEALPSTAESYHETPPNRQRSLHLRQWRRSVIAGESQPRLLALPCSGRWEFKELDPAAVRSAQIQLRQTLDRVMLKVTESMAQHANPDVSIVEWGDSPEGWAVASAGQLLRGQSARTLRLEDLPGLFESPAAISRHTLAFVLEPAGGAQADLKILVAQGASLPFHSEHIVHLRRTGQRMLPFELRALDESTGQAYRLATGVLPLPVEVRTQIPIHLSAVSHACGALELRFELPAWRFLETVLVDNAGRTHFDAASRALQINAECHE